MLNGMSKRVPWSVMQGIGDDWVVVMEWPKGVENGGPCRMVIEPVGTCPVGGLSSTVLRQIDFRDASDRLREQVTASERRGREHERYEKRRSERLRDELSRGVTEEYLALLSSAYVSAVNRGQAKPNDYLAELVGKTTSTVRGHLWQARNQDFLTGSPGRKGGQLTDKATKILERIVPGADALLSPVESLRKARESTDDRIVAESSPRAIGSAEPKRLGRKTARRRSET
jgi:hypothetical protein